MTRRDVNKITLTGRVEVEPEMRFTPEGEPHTTFYLLCAQPAPRDPHAIERFRLVAWGEPLAEYCNDLLPGAHVLVEGQLRSTTCEDQGERARIPYEVVVRDVVALSTLTTTLSDTAPIQQYARPAPASTPPSRTAPTPQPHTSRPRAVVPPPRMPRGPERRTR